MQLEQRALTDLPHTYYVPVGYSHDLVQQRMEHSDQEAESMRTAEMSCLQAVKPEDTTGGADAGEAALGGQMKMPRAAAEYTAPLELVELDGLW